MILKIKNIYIIFNVGQHLPLSGGSFVMVTKEPLGVVAGIGAWNFPMQTCVWKVFNI